MDRTALSEAIWNLRTSLLRLAVSIVGNTPDAEDAVSAAMVRAFERIRDLRDESAFRPWMMRITTRCAYDVLRRRKRELPRDVLPDMPVLMQTDGLFDLLMQLAPDERQALLLYYYEHFSTGEIAAALSVTRVTVSRRLSRGRERLKALLQAEGAENA